MEKENRGFDSVKIAQFQTEHEKFFEDLMADVWLCQEPIGVDEVKAVWEFNVQHSFEDVPLNEFEKTFGLSFQEICNWWNHQYVGK